MKRFSTLAFALLGLSGTMGLAFAKGSPAVAQPAVQQATKTTSFDIKNMTCALCPVTVKKAMTDVKGVKSVEVNFKAKTATVVFDPSSTNEGAIAAASANAGYPASIRGKAR